MSCHLLIVDDEDEIRSLLQEAFTSVGYRATGVSTLAEAMQVMRNDPPRLVITDLQLGEADGFEVVDQVTAVAPTIPIIMLTGVIMDPAEIPAPIREKIALYLPKTSPLSTILREVTQRVK